MHSALYPAGLDTFLNHNVGLSPPGTNTAIQSFFGVMMTPKVPLNDWVICVTVSTAQVVRIIAQLDIFYALDAN